MTSTASMLAVVEEIGPPLSGLFLCAEPNEAFFSPAVFKLGSNPVKATTHPHSVWGVFKGVKRFKQKHPLVGAEVNGFSGNRLSHE